MRSPAILFFARLSISLRRLVGAGGDTEGPHSQQQADESNLASPPAPSFLGDDFLDILQERRAIHDIRQRVSENPLLADHTLGINEKERPDRGHNLLVEDSVGPDDLPFLKVAEQRVWQLQRVGKGLLRKRVVGANAEDLDTQGFEPLVVGLPGRQVRGSGWNKSSAVEL
jgi:hypothetical protein